MGIYNYNMSGYKKVFKRVEKKYKLSRTQAEKIMPVLEKYMCVDNYGKTTICNIYFDTDDFKIIRTSIEKPQYKEKLRLRCYNVPNHESPSFAEIKKKVNGTVYKRRVSMPYDDAMEFLCNRKVQNRSQITAEIEYFLDFYKVKPKIALFYDRIAMFSKEDKNLRITIDSNMKWRIHDLDLTCGSYGNYIVDEELCILEIKVAEAVPLWFSSLMSEMGIYQTSFSKYGTAYSKHLYKNILKGKEIHA